MYKLTMTLILASLSFFVMPFSARAQDYPLKVESNVREDKSVDFTFSKKDPGTYTIIFSFNSLRNTNAAERQVVTATGFSGRAFTLKPIDPNSSVGFSYRYSYIRGKVLRKYNQEFTYMLPYKEGTKVRVAEAGYVPARYFGNETPEDWKSYNFYTDQEDTVLASRKGLVVSVKDEYDTSDPGRAEFKSGMNEVVIEHPDGTFARYRGLKKGIFVKEGETVIPGTALGMNTKFNAESRQYNLAFHLYYLKSDDVESQRGQTLKTSKSLYGSITPHFITEESQDSILSNRANYTAAWNVDLIKKELSKKEIKNLR